MKTQTHVVNASSSCFFKLGFVTQCFPTFNNTMRRQMCDKFTRNILLKSLFTFFRYCFLFCCLVSKERHLEKSHYHYLEQNMALVAFEWLALFLYWFFPRYFFHPIFSSQIARTLRRVCSPLRLQTSHETEHRHLHFCGK